MAKIVCAVLVTALVVAPVAVGAQITSAPTADRWRSRAEHLPIGSTVKLRLRGGERVTAVLMDLDREGLTVKPKTRVAEPSRRIPFDRIEALDRVQDRVSFGKYAGIGAAIGAAVFFVLLALPWD
jgi:hypothetical protein